MSKSDKVKKVNQIDPESLKLHDDLISDISIQGKLNVEIIVFRQIERTNMSALQGEEYFAANVRILLSFVPPYKRDEILERKDEYTSISKTLQFKYFCGVPQGTVKNPIHGSPFEVTEEIIEWYKLYEIILDTFNEMGITWKTEKWVVDAGKIQKEKIEPALPTPVFEKEVPIQEIAKKKLIRRCAVCGERVEPGTGKIHKHKLVHVDPCLATAKATWTKTVDEIN